MRKCDLQEIAGRRAIKIYYSYCEALLKYGEERQGEFLAAICRYGKSGENHVFGDEGLQSLFEEAKQRIDADRDKAVAKLAKTADKGWILASTERG